jgi:hypothetical protein
VLVRVVAVFGLLVKREGVGFGGDPTDAVPVGVFAVSLVMEDSNPRAVGSGSENGKAFPLTEILTNGCEALKAGELVGFGVEVAVDFGSLEGFFLVPAFDFIFAP